GGVMFAAVFMLTDPVTNPTSTAGRIIFALGVGILTVLIRVQANLPGGVLYSILIMNIFTPTIERVTDGWQLDRLKKYVTYTGAIAAVGIVLLAVVATQMEPVSGQDPVVDNGNGDQNGDEIRPMDAA
ncbi:MAG: NADH:ubiquinone oxidoreductase subunit RnfD, partial [Alphaproteobacteria bacterium]|nr:NADH:ubiquinone oxidoreductase subunit RnfD [Alphaproteobacteria bacterium]